MKLTLLLPVVLAVPSAFAQAVGAAPKAQTPGAITGHVLCADTQRPARLVSMRLLRVPLPTDLDDRQMSGFSGNLSDGIETSLDGSYTFHNVKPGSFYVVVEAPGYLTPIAQFTPKQLAATDKPTRDLVDATVKPVVVNAGQTVSDEITLERGASLSGAATYDDGTPASGLQVTILAKDPDGKWSGRLASAYRNDFGFMRTDDQGRFRKTGLPPGDYLVKIDLAMEEQTQQQVPMGASVTSPQGGTMLVDVTTTKFSLPLYPGNVWREKQSIPITLAKGEDHTGIDMQFPLNKLHPVAGQVLAKDGHAINSADVALLYPDDRSKLTDTRIQFDDQQFHIDFVPEGELLLSVTDAKDVTHVQVENPKGFTPRFHEEPKTVRTYGNAEQPLVVAGDTLNVNVMVPAAKAAEPNAQTLPGDSN